MKRSEKTQIEKLVEAPSAPETARRDAGGTKLPGVWVGSVVKGWSAAKSRGCLVALTLLCLVPFVGKAFHIDDTLFVWAAKHIVEKPFDPYGFSVDWYLTTMPMSVVTKNPPLAAYYGAAAGYVAGWSEVALHLAFLLPTLVLVLGVYQLASELTNSPLLAGLLTLLTPGLLVSATSVMCDVPMLAFWMMAILLWRWGLNEEKPWYLAGSGVLMGACALTKYFGVCVIPLLLLYSLGKRKSYRAWAYYLLIPVAMLGGYQGWTSSLYGRGLLFDAAAYTSQFHTNHPVSFLGASTVCLSFVGGCTLPALIFVPWLWRRGFIAGGCVVAAVGAAGTVWGWFNVGKAFPKEHQGFLAVQLALFIAGGISVLTLAAADVWRRRDADSVLLTAWVAGTFLFAAYLNWTVNARSVLPLIPAAAILMARRLDEAQRPARLGMWAIAASLVVCGVLSVWVTCGDTALADSGREAARIVHDKTAGEPGKVLFFGHWGFQYYMQLLGALPVDVKHMKDLTAGDFVVRPENNVNMVPISPDVARSGEVITLRDRWWTTTMRQERAAGFYGSFWGAMPFTWGSVPDEHYLLIRLPAGDATPER